MFGGVVALRYQRSIILCHVDKHLVLRMETTLDKDDETIQN